MGFNTSITICNDNLDDYRLHPQRFIDTIDNGLTKGIETWGITVHLSVHADATQLIAVGGNFSTRVFTGYYVGSHHTQEGQVALLRQWAESLGYRISKIPAHPLQAQKEQP